MRGRRRISVDGCLPQCVRADRPTTEEREAIRQLRRENEELKRVNEILRLASSFFASELDQTRRR